ncbi:MAG: ribonuclease P protein component [Candidatus Aminicenantes bacterium]
MDEKFSPQQRIRKKKDFLFLYRKGKRYRGKYFSLIYLANNLSSSRIAIVASKKVGNAVKRNKIKRWMRELFRRNKNLLNKPMDIVIIPKKDIADLSWSALQKEYLEAIAHISSQNSI